MNQIEQDLISLCILISDTSSKREFLLKRFLAIHAYSNELAVIAAKSHLMERVSILDSTAHRLYNCTLEGSFLPTATHKQISYVTRVGASMWLKMAYDTEYILEQCKYLEKADPFVHAYADILRKTINSKSASKIKMITARWFSYSETEVWWKSGSTK